MEMVFKSIRHALACVAWLAVAGGTGVAQAQPLPKLGPAFAPVVSAVEKAQEQQRQGQASAAADTLAAALQAVPTDGVDPMDAYLARDHLLMLLIRHSAARFDDAAQLRWLDERLALRQRFWGPHENATLAVRNARALQWCQMGRCADALAEQEAIARDTEARQGPDARNTLVARHNLTATLSDLGRHEQALAISQELAARAEKLWGPTDALTLRFRNGVAVALSDLGRYADALAAHEQLYALRQQALGPAAPDTLSSLRSIGVTYGLLHRHREALASTQQLLALTRQQRGDQHPDTAQAQIEVALALRRAGRLGQAREQAHAAWQSLNTLRGAQHPQTLTALNIYASVLLAAQDAEAALPATQQALDARLALMGAQHPLTLRARQSLGRAQLLAGQPDKALATFTQTHEGMRQVLGAHHPDTLLTLLDRMQAALAADQLSSVQPWLKDFQTGVEALRAQHGLSVKSRRSLFERYVDGYRLQALAALRAGQAQDAFALAELSKARTLLEGTALQYANRSGVLPPEAQRQIDERDARLAQIDRELDGLTQPDRRQALEAERNRAVRAHADTVAELRARYPRYARLAEPPQARLSDAARWLPADTLFISYLLTQDRVMALAVDASGLRRAVELPALPGLADAVDAFRRLTGDALEPGQAVWQIRQENGPERFQIAPDPNPPVPGAQRVTDAAVIGRVLARHLLAPLADELARHPRLLISPDGALATLPFEALPMPEGRWLAETHGVAYVQSLSMLGLLHTRSAQYQRLPERRDLLAVGNPVYSADDTDSGAKDQPPSSASAPAPAASAAPTRASPEAERLAAAGALAESDESVSEAVSLLREASWDDLPGTAREVAAVQQVLARQRVDVLTGPQASEPRLQALNQSGELARYKRLLFSVHGFLSPGVPALNALVLSQVGNPPRVDGYITAAEWPGYELRSDLVVMSACDTGLGRVVQGEGVLGLPYALYVAGNTHTVMTLWQVADDSTARFMQAFFQRLNEGASADTALADTKRDFARGLHGDKLRQPVYWAPFVLYGGMGAQALPQNGAQKP
ncbi:MAG: CHAT domain-containing protein [Pseudomonadota bacterium]|nr:CHAT domain-containing protein [Pseudomonadota bacterium]